MRAAAAWARENLFDGVWNTLLTLGVGTLLFLVARAILEWALTGARWEVVPNTLRLLAVGPFPVDQVWRVWLLALLVAFMSGASVGMWSRRLNRPLLLACGLLLLLALASAPLLQRSSWLFLVGAAALLPTGLWLGTLVRPYRRQLSLLWLLLPVPAAMALLAVPMNLWGGLLLTLIITVVSLAIAFPLGIVLALGRMSGMPIIRWLSTGFVELMRGVPLVSILFLAWLMIPLFVPEEWRTPQLVRAIIGFALFNGAYISEYVRGGLQGVPKGQTEGAKALGLGPVDTTWRIVLPQAIRSVIPGLVGQAITAFKNTSLVVIIGLLDLLGITQSILANPRYLGLEQELYLFLMVLYFALASLMSFLGRRIEASMGLGTR